MIDFASDVAAIFGDVLAVDAEYHRMGVGSAQVRVIPARPDGDTDWAGTTVRSQTTTFQIPVASAPYLDEGDHITFDGARFEVIGAPFRDARRLVWTAEARPIYEDITG